MDISNLKLDVIIQGGQSNSEGCGLGPVAKEYEPRADVMQMEAPRSWEVIKHPDGSEDLNITYFDEPFVFETARERETPDGVRGNLALTFASEYIEKGLLAEGRRILIVRAGVGGTGFKKGNWTKGGPQREKLFEMADFALAQNPENRVVAILWHQGEHDAFEKNDPEVYESELSALVSEMKEKYGERAPFIAADFCREWRGKNKEDCDRIAEKIKSVVASHQPAAFLDSSDLLSNNEKTGNGDDIHFCRESLHALGRRYFEAYERLV
jgi:hypothetical protein